MADERSRTSQPPPAPPDVSAAVFWRWVWTSVLPVLGYAFIVAGFVVIGAAWWGVSRTPIVAKQLPYIASGGLAGIGLIMVGSRYLVMQDVRRQAERLDRLERMVGELHGVLLARPDTPVPAGVEELERVSYLGGDRFVVLPGGRRFHQPGCRMIEGKAQARTVDREAVAERGLEPCPVCEPADVRA